MHNKHVALGPSLINLNSAAWAAGSAATPHATPPSLAPSRFRTARRPGDVGLLMTCAFSGFDATKADVRHSISIVACADTPNPRRAGVLRIEPRRAIRVRGLWPALRHSASGGRPRYGYARTNSRSDRQALVAQVPASTTNSVVVPCEQHYPNQGIQSTPFREFTERVLHA